MALTPMFHQTYVLTVLRHMSHLDSDICQQTWGHVPPVLRHMSADLGMFHQYSDICQQSRLGACSTSTQKYVSRLGGMFHLYSDICQQTWGHVPPVLRHMSADLGTCSTSTQTYVSRLGACFTSIQTYVPPVLRHMSADMVHVVGYFRMSVK